MVKQIGYLTVLLAVIVTSIGCSTAKAGWEDLKKAPRATYKLITQPLATLSFKEKVIVCSESITEEIFGVSSETFMYSTGDFCGILFKAFVARSKPGRAAKISRLVLGDIVTLDGRVTNGMLEINSLSRFKKAKRKKPAKSQLVPVQGDNVGGLFDEHS